MNKQSITELSEQRERLDSIKKGMIQLPKSRGASLATTALEKGRMYIGEMLFQLGKEYPYNKTKSATTADGIQDAVDISVVGYEIIGNEIQDLNKLREDIQYELDSFLNEVFNVGTPDFGVNNRKDGFIMSCNISEAYRGLKEARMWLGVRLGEIRDNNK